MYQQFEDQEKAYENNTILNKNFIKNLKTKIEDVTNSIRNDESDLTQIEKAIQDAKQDKGNLQGQISDQKQKMKKLRHEQQKNLQKLVDTYQQLSLLEKSPNPYLNGQNEGDIEQAKNQLNQAIKDKTESRKQLEVLLEST